ncbi:hypothetical protein B5F07_17805 [Lachnoclostridium sp. An169]|nr:hypothetical protein B5F07_17805 [Lachnoclostridium sp. An169]
MRLNYGSGENPGVSEEMRRDFCVERKFLYREEVPAVPVDAGRMRCYDIKKRRRGMVRWL